MSPEREWAVEFFSVVADEAERRREEFSALHPDCGGELSVFIWAARLLSNLSAMGAGSTKTNGRAESPREGVPKADGKWCLRVRRYYIQRYRIGGV